MTAATMTARRVDRRWACGWIGLVVVAIAVRSALFSYQSMDYAIFARWYDALAAQGGFGGIHDFAQFSNYNVPYLYLMAALTYLPVSSLVGLKAVSVLFDLVLAYYVVRIVALRREGWLPFVAAAIVLFLPTVVVNSSLWGQCDSIYASFSVGGLYYLLVRRPWLACTFFGIALAVKLQAVFVLPVLLLLVLVHYLPWRALLAIPAALVALDLPALLLGAPVSELVNVYIGQTGDFPQLTLNAPNLYQFLPAALDTDVVRTAGIFLAGLAVLVAMLAFTAARVAVTPRTIVLATAVSALLVPFLLPEMHERYFYLAEVGTVLAACWLPGAWYVPVLVQFASIGAYAKALLPASGPIGPANYPSSPEFKLLATAMLVALVALLCHTARAVRPDRLRRPDR